VEILSKTSTSRTVTQETENNWSLFVSEVQASRLTLEPLTQTHTSREKLEVVIATDACPETTWPLNELPLQGRPVQ